MVEPMSTRKLDVVCFGEVLIDFFPDRAGAEWHEIESFHRHLGGAPANVAVGLSRLGFHAALVTLVGRDGFGRFLRSRLEAEGVDIQALGEHPSFSTGFSFIRLDQQRERSFLELSMRTADEGIRPEDVDERLIGSAHVLHLCSSQLTHAGAKAATWKAVAAARAAGCAVSFDPNLRLNRWGELRSWRDEIARMLAVSDVVKLSREELERITGVSDPSEGAARLRALGARLVIVTLGAAGCYWQADTAVGTAPALPATVVDSTGAGDAFVVGLWASLLPRLRDGAHLEDLGDHEIRTACRRGNEVAARVVEVVGATEGLPRRSW